MTTNDQQLPGFRSCENHGFQIFFENGWGVSVQFGPGNYCSQRGASYFHSELWDSATAEVAVFSPPNWEFLAIGGDDPTMGNLKPILVGKIIALVSSLSADADQESTTHRVKGLLLMESYRKPAA